MFQYSRHIVLHLTCILLVQSCRKLLNGFLSFQYDLITVIFIIFILKSFILHLPLTFEQNKCKQV